MLERIELMGFLKEFKIYEARERILNHFLENHDVRPYIFMSSSNPTHFVIPIDIVKIFLRILKNLKKYSGKYGYRKFSTAIHKDLRYLKLSTTDNILYHFKLD
ncbi:MAG: hypothetical protein ACTSO9_21555, partial [Candidatus Helarchaeota archaeon]